MKKYFRMIDITGGEWHLLVKRFCPPVWLRGQVYTLGSRSLRKDTLGFWRRGSGVLQMLLSFTARSQWQPLAPPPRPRILPLLELTLCCWTPPGTTLPSATPCYPTSIPSSTVPTAGGTRWPGPFCMSKFTSSKELLLMWVATWTVWSNTSVNIETLWMVIQIHVYFFNWVTQPPYCSRGIFKWYSLFPFGDRSRLKLWGFGVFFLPPINSLSYTNHLSSVILRCLILFF